MKFWQIILCYISNSQFRFTRHIHKYFFLPPCASNTHARLVGQCTSEIIKIILIVSHVLITPIRFIASLDTFIKETDGVNRFATWVMSSLSKSWWSNTFLDFMIRTIAASTSCWRPCSIDVFILSSSNFKSVFNGPTRFIFSFLLSWSLFNSITELNDNLSSESVDLRMLYCIKIWTIFSKVLQAFSNNPYTNHYILLIPYVITVSIIPV